MTWRIEFAESAAKQLQKLDRSVQKKILTFLHSRLLSSPNPRLFGKPLKGTLSSYWRYRIGDYRILADIRDQDLVIFLIHLDHRRQVYK